MSEWEPARFRDYRWIVADPQLLGGRFAVRGTRLSVSLILECLANGMELGDINEAYCYALPQDAIVEIFRLASELTGSPCVAA